MKQRSFRTSPAGWVGGGWVAGEVENIAISTQFEVVVELKLELSLAKIGEIPKRERTPSQFGNFETPMGLF